MFIEDKIIIDMSAIYITISENSSNCTTGEVRLVGGANEMEGTVVVCYDNTWGTICSNYWDRTDANVVCKQLGYRTVGT